MLDTQQPLIAEFLKDHQHFSRLLYEIEKLLGKNRVAEARLRALDLDAMAGAHIAYEESELYPRLAGLGNKSSTENRLLDQHHEVLDALRMLINEPKPDEVTLAAIQRGFQTGLSHAEHCGSLISLMTQLDDETQMLSLKELQRLRNEGRKWTEIESSDADSKEKPARDNEEP